MATAPCRRLAVRSSRTQGGHPAAPARATHPVQRNDGVAWTTPVHHVGPDPTLCGTLWPEDDRQRIGYTNVGDVILHWVRQQKAQELPLEDPQNGGRRAKVPKPRIRKDKSAIAV
jgi:hypothetical protein